jgi:hypothetical protein
MVIGVRSCANRALLLCGCCCSDWSKRVLKPVVEVRAAKRKSLGILVPRQLLPGEFLGDVSVTRCSVRANLWSSLTGLTDKLTRLTCFIQLFGRIRTFYRSSCNGGDARL